MHSPSSLLCWTQSNLSLNKSVCTRVFVVLLMTYVQLYMYGLVRLHILSISASITISVAIDCINLEHFQYNFMIPAPGGDTRTSLLYLATTLMLASNR